MAKLQEICQNIGNDLPSEVKKKKSSSIDQRSERHHPYKSAVFKTSQSKNVKTNHSGSPSRSKSPAELIMSSNQLPTTAKVQEQTALDKQLAAQYQLMYQNIWYQAELERLKASQLQTTYQRLLTQQPPDSGTGINTGNSTSSNLDMSRLANLLLNGAYQIPGDIRALNQRLLIDRLSLPSSNSFLSPQEPQLHRCNWVTATGFCGKKFFSNEDLMLHLRSHVCNSAEATTPASNCSTGAYLPKLCRTQIGSDITRVVSSQQYQPYGLTMNNTTAAPLFH